MTTEKIKKPSTRRGAGPGKIALHHKRLIEEYLIDWNGTRAYKSIFPNASSETAATNAGKILSRADVKEYIRMRVEERNAELRIDQSYVVQRLHKVVEADYCGTIKYVTQQELDSMPEEVRKLVQSIKITKTRSTFNNGQDEREVTEYKVTFMSKDKALELLGRHTGSFLKDNEQIANATAKSFAQALKELKIPK